MDNQVQLMTNDSDGEGESGDPETKKLQNPF